MSESPWPPTGQLPQAYEYLRTFRPYNNPFYVEIPPSSARPSTATSEQLVYSENNPSDMREKELHEELDGYVELWRNDEILVDLDRTLLAEMKTDATMPPDLVASLGALDATVRRRSRTAARCGQGFHANFQNFIDFTLFSFVDELGQTGSLFVGEKKSIEYYPTTEGTNGAADITCGSTAVEINAGRTELSSSSQEIIDWIGFLHKQGYTNGDLEARHCFVADGGRKWKIVDWGRALERGRMDEEEFELACGDEEIDSRIILQRHRQVCQVGE
ncbi:hypothetical protein IAR50_006663 [Cryptococcus sp. DSM 104548]